MPEKVAVSPKQWLVAGPMHQWRFGVLTALVFVGMVVVWSVDGCTIKNFIQAWRLREDYISFKLNATVDLIQINQNLTLNTPNVHVSATQKLNQNDTNSFSPLPSLSQTQNYQTGTNNFSSNSSANLSQLQKRQSGNQISENLRWVSVELEPNLTSNLLARWLTPGGEPCKDSRTVEIAIRDLDGGKMVELSAGEIHEFYFQALDESGKPRCLGGDYFETDLSGGSWKSRPVVKDFVEMKAYFGASL